MGVSNGDWGGIGNISAYDPKDGQRDLALEPMPGPGEPDHDTWGGDSWKRGRRRTWGPASRSIPRRR